MPQDDESRVEAPDKRVISSQIFGKAVIVG
jgi:hypothetical protein